MKLNSAAPQAESSFREKNCSPVAINMHTAGVNQEWESVYWDSKDFDINILKNNDE